MLDGREPTDALDLLIRVRARFGFPRGIAACPDAASEPSAWSQHVPFARWLVHHMLPASFVELGTHTGMSYFAFCEAIRQAGHPCSAFAVDHWRGDTQAGFYDEGVFAAVSALNRGYDDFSSLMRMSFAEALTTFPDGSIDLLHIDGLHTYEAVSNDFRTWLPKVSSRGLVLLHDTADMRGDFGVHLLLDELRAEFATLELPFGNGLGVVARDPDRLGGASALFTATPEEQASFVAAMRVLGELVEARCDGARNEQLKRELMAARAELEHDRVFLRASEQLVETARRETAGLQAERAGLLADIDGLRAWSAELEATVTAMQDSRSWRFTRLLRRRSNR